MVRVNLIQFTLNRAKTNLAGIMDPKKGTGTDALGAKNIADDNEFESENTISKSNNCFYIKTFESLEIATKWPMGALQSTRKTQFAADARFRFQFKYYGGKNVSTQLNPILN